MSSDLIKRLRAKVTAHLPGGYKLCAEAADALEQMERDFRRYISSQVKRTRGAYACDYCRHRKSREEWAIGCQHDKCDGVKNWEWGNPDD